MSCAGGERASFGVIVLFLIVIGGCASDRTAARNPFQEKWGTLAEQSQGHSPSQRPQTDSVTEFDGPKTASAKTLPTVLVTLKMRNAEVNNILRALARSSGVSIMGSEAARGVMTVDFTNIPWDRVFRTVLNAAGLVYAWEGDILRVMTVHDMEKALKVSELQERRQAQALAEKMVEPFSTVLVAIDYAEAASLKDSLEDFLTKDKNGKPRGSIRVDAHNNALVIQAIREDIDRMLPVIQKIDKPTPQILIKANIVETTKQVARDLGVQWGGLKNVPVQGNNLVVSPGMDSSTGAQRSFNVDFPADPGQTAGGAAYLGLKYATARGNLLEMQLQALQKDGKLNIISSPSIITLDNQKAFTESGARVPYVTVVQAAGNAGTSQQVQFVDAVLRLEITPHVIDGTNLKMKIIVKKDEVDSSRSVQGNPFIVKKNTETVLIVQNGETIVISGLTKMTDSSSNTGVPWLKDIPLLGWLFRSSSSDNTMEDVLIFVTPQILPPQTAGGAASAAEQSAR